MEDAIYGVPDIIAEVLSTTRALISKKKSTIYEEFE